MPTNAREVLVRGSMLVVYDLFHVFRFNGIESPWPYKTDDGFFQLSVLSSSVVDRILCSWKDFVDVKLAQ